VKDLPGIWSRPRGLDHIVHAVRDLDAAADFYRRCGFQVSGRNAHPWGTQNCIVQLDGFYIEILAVIEPALIPPHGSNSFSFGAFNQGYLSAGEGLSMLLLGTDNAREDARIFREIDIGNFETFDFERSGTGPDGQPVKLAFSLAFARDDTSPHAGFATCQHHFPQNFWNPARQVHDNGVLHPKAVIMVADNPADHHAFLSAFTGVRLLQSNSLGVVLQTPNADIAVMEATSFRDRFGHLPTLDGIGATFAALTFAVAGLGVVEAMLSRGKVPFERRPGALVIEAEHAHGATLVFEDTAEH